MFLLLLGSLISHAGILEPSLEAAIPFYKTPQSPFPSGQARKSQLLGSQTGAFTDFHYKAQWGQKKIDVLNEQILREIDITQKARVRKTTSLLLMPELNSRPLSTLNLGQTVEIESLRGVWARVKQSSLNKGYVLLTDLETTEEDPGVWTALTEAALKKSADEKSKAVVRLPALTRLQLISLQGEYALVKTDSKSGFVALRDLVGRADFAQWAWNGKNKKWESVLYRDGQELVLIGNRRVPLKEYTAFKGVKNRALISGNHPVAKLGARVELIEPTATKWTQSIVKDHGSVWWKTDLLERNSSQDSITTAELMKKQLAGISYDPKKKKGLASANGIYRTLDGKVWTKISFFGQDNWPVLLHPRGVWYVGPYRSSDLGETFKPSIKWSELAETLQGARNKAFTHFRVVDVKDLSDSQVLLKIDTGVTIVNIKSHILGNYWTVAK